MADRELDELCINTIRFLAVDTVQRANSGHPGTPMGAAPMAYVLWDRFLKHNPGDPQWPDRDRFILSPGHASALLYALLHVSGYDLPMEELKRFRQWGSKTPGHPEYGLTPGVEMTTGPLGQGFAHGVGMAVAERWLRLPRRVFPCSGRIDILRVSRIATTAGQRNRETDFVGRLGQLGSRIPRPV